MRNTTLLAFLSLGAILGTFYPAAAQAGRGGRGANIPVTVEYRDRDHPVDRIQSDGGGAYDTFINQSPTDLAGNLTFCVRSTRQRSLDFTRPANTPPCEETSTCNKTAEFGSPLLTDGCHNVNFDLTYDNDNPDPGNGLLDIDPGETFRARAILAFSDPQGRNIDWVVHFKRKGEPVSSSDSGTSSVRVTGKQDRDTGEIFWEVSAECPDCLAKLESIKVGGGPSELVDEGNYSMPFKMTVRRKP